LLCFSALGREQMADLPLVVSSSRSHSLIAASAPERFLLTVWSATFFWSIAAW
jgi:hypothetical protein